MDPSSLKGRNKRLYNEWREMDRRFGASHPRISFTVERTNALDLPTVYRVFYNIPSFCGVENIEAVNTPGVVNAPIIASSFQMMITLPENYPCADGAPKYCFAALSSDNTTIPMPWHPNIRFFSMLAGRVCLNINDTFASLAHCVERIGSLLSYDLYHAENFPPYPEDLTVAQWVREQAEPNGWIDQLKHYESL